MTAIVKGVFMFEFYRSVLFCSTKRKFCETGGRQRVGGGETARARKVQHIILRISTILYSFVSKSVNLKSLRHYKVLRKINAYDTWQ